MEVHIYFVILLNIFTGDKIEAGEVIAEVETDKAVAEVVSTKSGYLAKILAPSGSGFIAVGQASIWFKGSN